MIDYVTERNKLIPTASKIATEKLKAMPNLLVACNRGSDRSGLSGLWNRFFHEEMDRLWAEEKQKQN